MVCKNCKGEIPAKLKGRGRKRTDFCQAARKGEWHGKAYRAGSRALRRKGQERPMFETEILRPENQARIAEALAWAEAKHPATPEAWGYHGSTSLTMTPRLSKGQRATEEAA